MACNPEALKHVPLFALLDEEETAVLAGQVELKKFAPRQRIYKMGDASGQAYVMVSGKVRVTTLDQDQQEVIVDEPSHGEFFGFASMLDQTPHQTSAIALEETECLEVSRQDISVLLQRKPQSERGHREGSNRGRTPGRLGGPVWRLLGLYPYFSGSLDDLRGRQCLLAPVRLGPVPLYTSQSIPLDARGDSSAGDYDEPESPGHERSPAQRTGL